MWYARPGSRTHKVSRIQRHGTCAAERKAQIIQESRREVMVWKPELADSKTT